MNQITITFEKRVVCNGKSFTKVVVATIPDTPEANLEVIEKAMLAVLQKGEWTVTDSSPQLPL